MPEVNYFWDEIEDNVIEEYDENGNTIVSYTTEPTLYGSVLSQDRGGQVRHYHFDGQGNTTELTDANGNVTDTRRYSAFGEVTESTGTTEFPFQFGGRWGYLADALLQNIVIRRRVLEYPNGRWTSVDPIVLNGSERAYEYTANERQSQRDRTLRRWSLSLYPYASNNPIRNIDPSGLQDCAYYKDKCRCTSWWNLCQVLYYCLAADLVCKNAGNGPWTDCVRRCLQAYDEGRGNLIADGNVPIIGTLIGCVEHVPLEVIDHVLCFAVCRWDTTKY